MRNSVEYTILDAVTPVAITSSTDATPIVVTATAHGFVTGNLVMIQGHATNIAANGIFLVTRLSSSTFSLQNRYTNVDIAGSGAGAGVATGIVFVAPKILLVQDFKTIELTVFTSGTATTTIEACSSMGKVLSNSTDGHGDTPNFGATTGKTIPYTFVQIVDLQAGASVNGDTGIVIAGTDILKTYEVNTNTLKYFTMFPVSWTAGAITIKAFLSSVE